VIMLLDLKEEERRKVKAVGAGLGTIAVGAIGFSAGRTDVYELATKAPAHAAITHDKIRWFIVAPLFSKTCLSTHDVNTITG